MYKGYILKCSCGIKADIFELSQAFSTPMLTGLGMRDLSPLFFFKF